MSDRKIIHITAGNDNWTPTPEELTDIATLFQSAILDSNGVVLVTRTGVSAEVTSVQDGGDYQLVTAEYSKP